MSALNAANYSYLPPTAALKVQKTALLLRVLHIVRNFMQVMFLACTCISLYTQARHIKIIWHICKTGIRCAGAKKSALRIFRSNRAVLFWSADFCFLRLRYFCSASFAGASAAAFAASFAARSAASASFAFCQSSAEFGKGG